MTWPTWPCKNILSGAISSWLKIYNSINSYYNNFKELVILRAEYWGGGGGVGVGTPDPSQDKRIFAAWIRTRFRKRR